MTQELKECGALSHTSVAAIPEQARWCLRVLPIEAANELITWLGSWNFSTSGLQLLPAVLPPADPFLLVTLQGQVNQLFTYNSSFLDTGAWSLFSLFILVADILKVRGLCLPRNMEGGKRRKPRFSLTLLCLFRWERKGGVRLAAVWS